MEREMCVALAELLPRLRRFGVALTGSIADADELVQDACERAIRRAGQLRDGARLDAWLYGIMRNRWMDEVRWRRIRRHEDIEAASEVPGEDGQRMSDARMTLDAVRRAMAGLPEEQRAVLILVCVDGLSYKEAANVLGVAIGTVMSRLSRGRRALHAVLAERGPADEARRIDPPILQRASASH
jgi:RNA polymerase sigma-70 factor (ECF subfamily)